ncbi:MAG: PEP-CTERM sorting domain-containing protein [Aquabacterium sp.]|nr:PEP-CTERM sorting domain-containing protein [Aquabacterium sp.]
MNLSALKKSAVALALCGLAGASSAGVIVSTYGDLDGFGQQTGFAGTITDRAHTGSQSWSQSFGPLSGIVSATIKIGHAALGFYPPNGVPRLFLDSILVGNLTDMDACDGSAAPGVVDCGIGNYKVDLLTVTSIASLADGVANFRIETGSGDAWVLDYSQLTITTRDVPEPGTLMLIAAGFVGAGVARYRKQQGK